MLTRDVVIQMAKDAGFNVGQDAGGEYVAPQYADSVGTLERLVLAAYQRGAQDEREECAKVAEGFAQNRDWVRDSLYESIRNEVAARIRARGEKGGA